jgi:large subunit ribosomal protein L4
MATRTTKAATSAKKQEVKKEAKPAAKKAGINAVMFSSKGEKSTTSLSEAVFGQKENRVLLAQAVRVFLTNQRSAQAKTKGRGEIRYTTAKVYRQKGTGHARHGDKAAPIFVGGGIAHGPSGVQNYKRSLSKVLRRKVLGIALSVQAAKGKVVVADWEKVGPKTNVLGKLIKNMNLRYPMVLVSGKNQELARAARNLEGISMVSADQLTAYQVLQGKNLIVTPEAVSILEQRIAGAQK